MSIKKEKLTKEEAIRRHRLMWNYIADESARTRTRINKVDALIHFRWEKMPFNLCWCCEYANQNYNTLCDHCPLDFAKGNANGVKYCAIGYTDANGTCQYGLYAKWSLIKRLDSCDSEKLDEYIDLAKRIANLSEKED